jgi:hypothetical protein
MDANEKHRLSWDSKQASGLSLILSSKKLLILGLLASSALMISLASWTLSSPLGSSPDENFHIGSIWCADGEKDGRCEYIDYSETTNANRVSVPHVMDVCFIFYSEQSGNCSWDTKSVRPELQASENGAYPDLFYEVTNILVSDHTQVSGLAMRLATSALASLLVLGAIIFSPARTRGAALVGFLVTLIPLAIFLIPSLNPSSWAYLGLAFAWVFQMNAMTNHETSQFKVRSNWALFIFCTALAMGSRWDAMLYSCLSILVVTYLASKDLARFEKAKLLIPGIMFLIGVTFLINHYKPSAVQGSGVFGNPGSITADWEEHDRNIHNLINLVELPAGVFGLEWGIGWLDTPLPKIVALIGISVYMYFLIQSLPYRNNGSYFVFALLVLVIVAILFYYLWGSRIIVGEVVQPRYILPMIPLLIGISLWSSRLPSPLSLDVWARSVLLGLLISVTHSMSLWTNIRRYTLGLEPNQGFSLSNPDSPIEWWWRWAPSPNFVFFTGTIAFTVFTFTLLRIVSNYKEFDKSLDLAMPQKS